MNIKYSDIPTYEYSYKLNDESNHYSDELIEKDLRIYQWNENNKKYDLVCNFTFYPIELLIYLYISGKKEKYIKFAVIIEGKEKNPIEIPLVKSKTILKKIREQYPSAYIVGNIKPSIFERMIAQKYMDAEAHIKETYIVNFPGWKEVNNKYIYFHAGLPNCNCERVLPKLGNNYQEILRNGLSCMNLINEPQKMIPLFLFAHLGYLYIFFDIAGFKPNYALYVFGNTNCRKTSLFKILFNIFVKERSNQNINFNSTATAMEMIAQCSVDDTLVIDDLSLTNGRENKEMINKFEYVIRLCGDGIAKRRSNKDLNDTIKFSFRSAVAMNGEDLPYLSQSSLLRLFIIEFDENTVNNEVLKVFQRNQEYMQQYFALFIKWLENNYEDCCKFIKDNYFDIFEKLDGRFQYPRMQNLAVILILVNSIITKMFIPSYGMSINSVNNEALIIQAVQTSEEFSNKIEPYKEYLKALSSLLATGEVLIADSKEIYIKKCNEGMSQDYIGFIDKETEQEYYYLNPAICYELVCKYYKKINRTFPVSIEKIHSELNKEGFLVIYKGGSRNGYLKKVTVFAKKRTGFLCLIKSKVDSFFNKD